METSTEHKGRRLSRRLLLLGAGLALAVGATQLVDYGTSEAAPPTPQAQTAAIRPAAPTAVAVGTVVESRSYQLLASIKGRPKRIFLQAGQYVHKGDILVKGWDHGFALAPTDAIVLEQLAEANDYLQPSTPVALLAAVHPFRVALPLEKEPRKVGTVLRLRGTGPGGQVATGVVISSTVSGQQSILELRLRSLEQGLMAVGAGVRVEPMP
jgi:multidrug efflux pump subunit AcrA (membrane-fusion protein)